MNAALQRVAPGTPAAPARGGHRLRRRRRARAASPARCATRASSRRRRTCCRRSSTATQPPARDDAALRRHRRGPRRAGRAGDAGRAHEQARPFSRTILDGLGVAPRFARIWGPDDVPARKPDPAGLLRLVDELGARAATTLDDRRLRRSTWRPRSRRSSKCFRGPAASSCTRRSSRRGRACARPSSAPRRGRHSNATPRPPRDRAAGNGPGLLVSTAVGAQRGPASASAWRSIVEPRRLSTAASRSTRRTRAARPPAPARRPRTRSARSSRPRALPPPTKQFRRRELRARGVVAEASVACDESTTQ